MKRAFAWVLVAGTAVWAGALFDFRHRAPNASTETRVAQAPEDIAAQGSPSARGVSRARGSDSIRDTPAEGSLPVAAPNGERARAPSGAVQRAAQGTVKVIGKIAHVVLTATRGSAPQEEQGEPEPSAAPTGELGDGVLSPEYARLEHNYVDEARDGEWAPAQEQRIRGLLRDQTLADKVALVHCQQSVCRIVLESDSPDVWNQLLAVPGLRDETALSPQSPYSLRSGQLSVYFHPASGQAESPKQVASP